MFSTIQTKNTVSIIAVVLVVLTILLLVNYILLRGFSLENAERTSELILNSADSQLEISFDEIEALVTSLASIRAVREVDVDDMSELFINNVLVRSDNVRAIYLGTRDGDMYEWGIGEGFVDYQPVFPEGYDPRNRPWYRLAMKSGSYDLTPPYVYASIEALGVTAVIPVLDDGDLVGVLGLDLILQGLDNLVNSLSVPMGGRVILLNQEREILVSQFAPKTGSETQLEIFPYPALMQDIDGFIIDEVYGNRYMISSIVNNATGWTMLLFLPYTEIMDFSQRMIFIIIAFDLLLVFLLGSLIGFITRTSVIKPLDEIISVFRRFESGDMSARIPPLPGMEFNLMARLFNRLSDLSAESSQRMEEKVEQRTRAVIKLQTENIRLRIIEEKERIYENLHDSLGARLTGINISNHVARSALNRGETEVLTEMLERIENNTQQGIQDLRDILAAGSGDKGLYRDFYEYIDRVVRERLLLKEINLITALPDRDDVALLDPDLTVNLEKMIQELVSNTMKHSNASGVWIELGIDRERVHVRYRDNGEGFIVREALKSGFGLHGLFSRVERMDGILKITSKPDRGACFDFHFRISE